MVIKCYSKMNQSIYMVDNITVETAKNVSLIKYNDRRWLHYLPFQLHVSDVIIFLQLRLICIIWQSYNLIHNLPNLFSNNFDATLWSEIKINFLLRAASAKSQMFRPFKVSEISILMSEYLFISHSFIFWMQNVILEKKNWVPWHSIFFI